MKKIDLYLGTLILILIGVSIVGCAEIEYTTEPTKAPTKTEQIKILEHKMTFNELGNLIIAGVAQNVGEKQISYAEIRVRFYDKDDVLLGTSLDNINDVDPGQKWKFEVMYLGLDIHNVDHYDIGIGTTW